MSKPYKCPVCRGTQKREDGSDCTACERGVVWEPEEAAERVADEKLDLTYERE